MFVHPSVGFRVAATDTQENAPAEHLCTSTHTPAVAFVGISLSTAWVMGALSKAWFFP
jgi:hypothetical protein